MGWVSANATGKARLSRAMPVAFAGKARLATPGTGRFLLADLGDAGGDDTVRVGDLVSAAAAMRGTVTEVLSDGVEVSAAAVHDVLRAAIAAGHEEVRGVAGSGEDVGEGCGVHRR